MIPEIRQTRVYLTNLEVQLEDLINNTQKIQQENVQLKSDLFALQEENKRLKEEIKKKNNDGENSN